ncbi:hypothetical protein Taro_031579 [Colocasia esculenta]|uniref:Gag protein n=1 Tax=Colocasia esculenta TaxID=4460 RepID=A0A843VJ61_COLES|nr:hypothetical protein [Colocasia esculenta]
MASRGRRGGVPTRDGGQRRDEPRHEEQTEQQALAPQGPVHPPPPPVDYGVFMQSQVQAMQTQAYTKAALQAQMEAQAQVPVPQAQDHGGPSIMERFKRMLPPSFKGESEPLLVESWTREIEKIVWAVRCADEDKVTLATYMLQVSKTVLEYEARLAELSKYAPHIVIGERRKATKFVMGLKPSLRMRLVVFDHRILDEALSATCRKEGEMEQYLEEKNAL